jgi:hypothetical protein
MRHRLLTLLSGLLATFVFSAEKALEKCDIPTSPAKAEDRQGFEGGQWDAEAFGNAVEARTVSGEADRNQMLCIHYKAGASEKGALKRMTGLVAAEKGTLRACVYTGEISPPRVAFAICTGDKYEWQETEAVKLSSGWNQLSFALHGKNWKSAASEWKNNAAPAGIGDVRAIDLIIYSRHDSVLYLDAVKIDRDDKAAGIDQLIKKLGADDFAEREAAEKALLALGRKALEAMNDLVERAEDAELVMRAKRIQAQLNGMGWQKPADNQPPRRIEDIEVAQ